MSSPSRQVIDPLICSYSEHPDRRPKMPLSSSGSGTSKFFSTQSQPQGASSGWTPLVSRTFNNEMVGSLNSTPGLKMYTSIHKQNGPSMDADFGLNLTPFLTHSMNLLSHPQSTGNASAHGSFTPFYDKTMHMADFFMDLPIRQTPGKIESLTPSRFELREDMDAKLNAALSVKKHISASSHQPKRSITQLDTPARQPAKKIDTATTPGVKIELNYGSDTENFATKKFDDAHFVTPSKKKGLREFLALTLNKTPLPVLLHDKQFLTPAAKYAVSSPSTVIMSSAVKSPTDEDSKRIHPPSPTPNKDKKFGTGAAAGAIPVMGTFSERKPAALNNSDNNNGRKQTKKSSGGAGKFQIVFTDVHTLMNSKKKKNGDTAVSGKSGKKCDRKKGKNKAKVQEQAPQQTRAYTGNHYSDQQNFASGMSPAYGNAVATSLFNSGVHPTSSFSMSQDFNTSMSSSKEFSMVNNSTVNSTVNTTHGNMSSMEHASFEMMHGGLISTPNGKFLLDNLFEKHSPTVMHHMSASRFANGHGENSEKHEHFHAQLQDEMHASKDYMPPPPKSFTIQQATQAALRQEKPYSEHLQHQPEQSQLYHQTFSHFQQFAHQQQHRQQHPPSMAMNMLMSTPQHESIMHSCSHEEPSPSDKESMRYLYQQLHQLQPIKSPHCTNSTTESSAKTPTGSTKKAPKRKSKKR